MNLIRVNINNYKLRMCEKQKFCAVVKADAYGLGARKICAEIDDVVDYFAVSSQVEFFEIKKVVTKPILLLDPIYENITNAAKQNCEFCVSNMTQFEKILKLANVNKNVFYRLHLAFNSGMNRFGFNKAEDILECFRKIKKTQNISIIGVFSHFYAGNNKHFAKKQSMRFDALRNFLASKIDISKIVFHIANSSGFENVQDFDLIRIGLGMFLFDNRIVFSLESKVIEIRSLKIGETLGYGALFFASSKMMVAVVAIGYADGISRRLAGRGFVLVNGFFCKILAVCMDSIIIDVTGINVSLEDKVTLIGKNGCKEIFICDFARWCDTIEYEIMTRISRRVKRVYLGGKNANHNRKVQS